MKCCVECNSGSLQKEQRTYTKPNTINQVTAINYVVEDEVEHEQSENEDTTDNERFNTNEYGIVISLEQVHNIQPENCFIEALYFFDILTDDLKECKHNHEKRQLQVLLEASQIILQKIDTYCESSVERRKLCKSINEYCDQVENLLEGLKRFKKKFITMH